MASDLSSLIKRAAGRARRSVWPTAAELQGREDGRLCALPRRVPATTRMFGLPIELLDGPSFVSQRREIFDREVFRFSATPEPKIIDCGANIGMSVLYWSRRYPGARVDAFEADPRVFEILRRNCHAWGLRSTALHCKAVWTANGPLQFAAEGSDSGRITNGEAPALAGSRMTTVDAVRLADLLMEPVDMLKMDIEGAETDVILDCADRLRGVRNLFVEYHSFVGAEQRLDELLAVIRGAGFRYNLQHEGVERHPLIDRANHNGMDGQIDIFAFRG